MKFISLFISCLLFYAFQSNAQILWPENKKAAIILTYDDGLESHLNVAIPQLEAVSLHGTFYLYGQTIRPDDIHLWREAAKKGHEIGNHSLYHPCLNNKPEKQKEYHLEDYTLSQIVNEVSIMNSFLSAIDGNPCHSYAYPCGHALAGGEDYSEAIMQSGVVSYARGGNRCPIIKRIEDIDFAKVGTYPVLQGYTAGQLISAAQQALEQGGLSVFVFHGIGGEYLDVDKQAHEQLLFYLSENSDKYWVTTFSKVMDYLSNFTSSKEND